MSYTTQQVLDALDIRRFYEREVGPLQETGPGQYMALCPFHKDSNPSLAVNTDTGKFYCHGCGEQGDVFGFYEARHKVDFAQAVEALAREAGLDGDKPVRRRRQRQQPAPEPKAEPRPKAEATPENLTAQYDYQDAHGGYLFTVRRYEQEGRDKDFRQGRKVGGDWEWGLDGVKPVPYHLPEVLEADTVFIAEGEKDADNLRTLGLCATTCPMGAGKWRAEYNQHFAGKAVVVLPDNDDAGRNHARTVACNLVKHARTVKVLALPGLPPKGDATDWLEAGGTREALEALTKQAEPYQAQAQGISISGADLARMDLPKADPLLGDWLTSKSFVLVAAQPGAGKTWFALEVARAVATGSSAFGGLWEGTGQPRKVVFVDGELPLEGQDGLQVRAMTAKADLAAIHYINRMDYEAKDNDPSHLWIDKEDARDVIEQEVLDKGAHLLILDNLSSLHSNFLEDDNRTWAGINHWIIKLRSKGIATILVHHTTQEGNKQHGTDMRRGQCNLDIVLIPERKRMDKTPDKAVCAFRIEKGKYRGKVFNVHDRRFVFEDDKWKIETRHGELSKIKEDENNNDKLRDLAMVSIMSVEGRTRKEITDAVGVKDHSTISKYRKELESGAEPWIRRRGKANKPRFELTPHGKEMTALHLPDSLRREED